MPILQTLRVIITNGDQREMEAICECLNKIFLKAKRVIFGWHIDDIDWERNLRCLIGYMEKSTKHNCIK